MDVVDRLFRFLPVTSNLSPSCFPCQASSAVRSAAGLVGPGSASCDGVRWEVLIESVFCDWDLTISLTRRFRLRGGLGRRGVRKID